MNKEITKDIKDFKGKTPLSNLLDFKKSLKEVSGVREFGNTKYPDKESYKQIPNDLLFDATLRHIFECIDNEFDKESGRHHLAHAVVNLLMIMEKRF